MRCDEMRQKSILSAHQPEENGVLLCDRGACDEFNALHSSWCYCELSAFLMVCRQLGAMQHLPQNRWTYAPWSALSSTAMKQL